MDIEKIMEPRLQFRNAGTGEPPTPAEWEEMKERAHQILENWQYSAPEQIDWAMAVDPGYLTVIGG